MGVAPRGSSFTSPRGVNTYTSSGKSSTFTVLRNSRGSFISFCSSRIWRSHTNIWSPLSVICFPSPYRPGDDPEPDQVVDVLEIDSLARHLVEDARDVLGAARDHGVDLRLAKLFLQEGGDLPCVLLPAALSLVGGAGKLAKIVRGEDLEAPVLELHLH